MRMMARATAAMAREGCGCEGVCYNEAGVADIWSPEVHE